jgi:uncharacterized membrane protein YukC
LTGEVHEQRVAAAPQRKGGLDVRVAYAVATGLLVLVVGAIAYASRYYAAWSKAEAAIKAAQETVVYEPLSKVNDGSYEESGSDYEGQRRAIGLLRRLRRR